MFPKQSSDLGHSPSYPEPSLNSELMRFIGIADRLKGIVRANSVLSGTRLENSAEHCWHVAIAAMVLVQWSNEPVDIDRVIRMLLIHDIIEIEAGDINVFDGEVSSAVKLERERLAAQRIFQGTLEKYRIIWEEFETGSSADAKFARSIDMFMPMFLDAVNGRINLDSSKIRRSDFIDKKRAIEDGSTKLWEYSLRLVDYFVAKGWILN